LTKFILFIDDGFQFLSRVQFQRHLSKVTQKYAHTTTLTPSPLPLDELRRNFGTKDEASVINFSPSIAAARIILVSKTETKSGW